MHYDYNTGRLHVSWSWAERIEKSHVDICYAYSDDDGRNWFNSAGTKIGSPGRMIGVGSPGLVVWNLPPGRGLDNQQGQYVDSAGRPHILVWHLRNNEESRPKRDPAQSAYYHYWRDDKGKWRQNEVFHPVGAGADGERNRAKILSTSNNDLIAMFNYQGKIVLCGATAENQYRDWKVIHKEEGPWDGEPLPDLSRWREEGVLSIYMQKDPSKDGEPTDLYIIDFRVSVTEKNK